MHAFVNHEQKYLIRTEAVVILSGAVLTGNCESPDMGVIQKSQVKKQLFLTVKPSL